MNTLERVGESATTASRILTHYELVAPLMVKRLAETPIVYRSFPHGVESGGWCHQTALPLTVNRLLRCVRVNGAVEFYTWAPLPGEESRLQFGRILLLPPEGVAFVRVKEAAKAMRRVLHRWKIDAVPLLDGLSGIALWIPFSDAPEATILRTWLHGVCNLAVEWYPSLLSTEFNTHRDGRVHAHVGSNAPHCYSMAPYSLRAPKLSVCTPLFWEEIDSFKSADAVDMRAIAERLRGGGDDAFSVEAAAFAARFRSVGQGAELTGAERVPEPRGHIVVAAIEILEDGKTRDAQEILAEALVRKLVPPQTTRKYVYTSLIEYIARQRGRGRKPAIVQDEKRSFRINEPPDDWPDLVAEPHPAPDAAAQALCDRLERTARGKDPAAFELAVCDAFAHLGFLTQHLGKYMEPDGAADAILGALGYRVLIECKTAKGIVTDADPLEVAKFRDAYHGQYCVIVGPAFGGYAELLEELQTHRVTAIAVPELQTLLHIGATALEVKKVLRPGFAADVIADVLWEREHGAAKRVATIAELVVREGWKQQAIAASEGGADNAPNLTIDAAMMLVDDALRSAGSVQSCQRGDVELAFAWLTSPNVGLAVRESEGLVLVRSATRAASAVPNP